MDGIFTTEELKEIKAQIDDVGFPSGGQLETQIFCALVKAQAQLKASQNIKDAIDGIKKVMTNAIDMYQPFIDVLKKQLDIEIAKIEKLRAEG